MNSSATINPAFSIRRPIQYDAWLQVRDERNRLAMQVAGRAARIRELQGIIEAQRAQLLSATTNQDTRVRAEIERGIERTVNRN